VIALQSFLSDEEPQRSGFVEDSEEEKTAQMHCYSEKKRKSNKKRL